MHTIDNETEEQLTDHHLDLPTLKSVRLQQRQGRISPDSSPHKLGKIGPKWKRTVAVKNISRSLHENSPSITPHNNFSHSVSTVLTLENFQECSDERKERNTVQSKLLSYILQKYTADHYSETGGVILSEVRQFLGGENCNMPQQPSTIHYLELVDEAPDSSETMSLIAEQLLEKFGDIQNGWVVLVGDGKTYKHLMNIKKQYSTALQKLLIFPGDWHILKNYQPILIIMLV